MNISNELKAMFDTESAEHEKATKESRGSVFAAGATHVILLNGRTHLAVLAHYKDLEEEGLDVSGIDEDYDYWVDPHTRTPITKTWVGELSYILPDKEKWTLNTPE